MEMLLKLAAQIAFWASVATLACAFCCLIAGVESWLDKRREGE